MMGLSPQLQLATKVPASRMQEQKQPSPRVAIKVKGKIIFINLSDVVTVQADGDYVSLQQRAGWAKARLDAISAAAH